MANTEKINVDINILLQENVFQQQEARLIGFVMTDDIDIKLNTLREQIKNQFDEVQLASIGQFQFVKRDKPISQKQEPLIKMKIISKPGLLTSLNLPTPTERESNPVSFAFCQPTSFDLTTIDEKAQNNMNNNASCIFDQSAILSQQNEFESVPHHYQYLGSQRQQRHLNTSNTSFNLPAPFQMFNTLSSNQNNTNDPPFPKIRFCSPTSEKERNKGNKGYKGINNNDEYNIFIRNNLNTTNPLSMHSSHSNSTLIFSPINKIQPNKSDFDLSSKLSAISNNQKTNNKQSFLTSLIVSPRSTRLEEALGEKLPRIQTSGNKTLSKSNEIGAILKNAIRSTSDIMMKNNNYKTIKEENNKINMIPIDKNEDESKNDSKNTSNTFDDDTIREISINLNEDENDLAVSNNNHSSSSIIITIDKPVRFSKAPSILSGNININLAEEEDTRDVQAAAAAANMFLCEEDEDEDVQAKLKNNVQPVNITVIGTVDTENNSSILDCNNPSYYTYNNKNLRKKTKIWQFFEAHELIKGLSGVYHSITNPLWIDIVCSGSTFASIAEHIRPTIHNLTIEDCMSINCREKLEIFNDYLFVCIRTSSENYKSTENIHILVFKSMIITYHHGSAVTNQIILNCRNILQKRHFNMCPSPSWVCHTIIDNIIDGMIPEVESTVHEVEICQQFVFKLNINSQNELLHRMQIAREWMVLYKSRLWPKSTITHNLLNNIIWRKDFLYQVPQPYWRDINDHVARMVDLLELGTETLESIQNIFVAKVSLEITQQSNILAKVAGKLTSVGSIFIPLTIITGIFGMNCKVPFQYMGDNQLNDNYTGFLFVTIIMIVSSILTWKIVKYQGWFDPVSNENNNYVINSVKSNTSSSSNSNSANQTCQSKSNFISKMNKKNNLKKYKKKNKIKKKFKMNNKIIN